jgi:dTDP-L-rhamnose 4-epimerase
MKILVTGGAGFIGSHVVDALAAGGADVLCLDSLDPGVHHRIPDYLRDDVEYCFADLRHFEPDSRFDNIEAIIHLAALGGVTRAAREPANIIDANCRGTARLLEYARRWPRLRRLILAGSFSVYGSNYSYVCPDCGGKTDAGRREQDLAAGRYEVYCPKCGGEAGIVAIAESAAPAPLETYGASKYMQELCLRGFSVCPVHILRFSSVYGRRLRLDDGEATIIARIAGWIEAGRPPQLFEDGRQIRDWVFVGDIVEAMLRILNGAAAPPIVNVCSGIPTTLSDACRFIAAAYGAACTPVLTGGYRAGDMRHCLGDPANLRTLIRREPVRFKDGAGLAFGNKSHVLMQGSKPCAEYSSLTA